VDLGLNDRVAIVTGASRGLGRATAGALLLCGEASRFVTGSGLLVDGGELTGI